MINKYFNFKLCLLITAVFFCTGCQNSANKYYKDGIAAYNKGNYSEAAAFLEKALNKNPDKAEYYIEYGFALAANNEYDKAVEVFLSSILDKDIDMVKENNKRAYRGAGIACYMNSDYNAAIEYFDKALEYKVLNDLDIDILLYKAQSYEAGKEVIKALDVYNELFERGKDTPAFHIIKADVYRKQSEYENSLEEYNKAISLEANNFYAYFGKYAMLIELGRNAEAEEVLNIAEEIEVYDDAGLLEVGKVHFYQKNYKTAKIELTQSANKGFSEAYYYLAEICVVNKEYEKAIEYYKLYIDDNNKPNANLYIQMSTCYLMLGDYEEAGNCITLAASYNDFSIRQVYVRNKIIYLEYIGEFTEAYELMERYCKLYPEDKEAEKERIFIESRIKEAEKIKTKQ